MNDTSTHTKALKDQLKALMQREIALMRELLSSFQQEQQSLLACDTSTLSQVLKEREPLVELMAGVRDDRIDTLIEIAQMQGRDIHTPNDLTQETSHSILELFAGEECDEILALRDQMLSLVDAMNAHSSRNNYLLEAKIQTTRQLIDHLHPADPHKTYGVKGTPKKSTKVTVAVINKEA